MKQIKNLVYTLLLSVLGATMFTACSEEEGVVDAKDLVLSKEELLFFAEPGEYQEVTFTANADWKATSEQGWILIDTPVGKKGESTVSISVKENTEKVARQGSVIISEPSTGKMASFKVKQEAQGVKFIVSPENGEFVIDDENQIISQKINVKANFDYDIRIVDTEWVTYSVGEDGEIVFNADIMQPLPTEPKDVKIEFVPTEEGAETKSVTIKWNGYTPYVKFYREIQPEAGSQSQEVTYEEITGNVEFDKMGSNTVTYVESNVPWTFSKEGVDFTSLISYNGSKDMTKAKELPYAVKTKAALFVNYDKAKLTNEDEALTLSFSFGEETKTLTFSKKGYNIYFDESQFRTLIDINDESPNQVPTFPAVPSIISGDSEVVTFEETAQEEPNGLSLEFKVLAAYPIEPIIFKKQEWGYQPLNNNNLGINGVMWEEIEEESKPYNNVLTEYTYKITVDDRSKQGKGGDKLNFKLYFAKYIDEVLLFMQYFEPSGWTIKPEKVNDITTGMDFAQKEYYTLFEYSSKDITVDGKNYSVPSEGKTLELKYKSNHLGDVYIFNENTIIEGDFIDESSEMVDVTAPLPTTKNIISSFAHESDKELNETEQSDDNYILRVNIAPNNTTEVRKITLYFGAMTEDYSVQYFGKFTINQAAASSPTPEQ